MNCLGNEKIPNMSAPSKQQKQHLKDKFKSFNNELDELFRIQSDYSVPDAELRSVIRESTVDLIGMAYEAFYKS